MPKAVISFEVAFVDPPVEFAAEVWRVLHPLLVAAGVAEDEYDVVGRRRPMRLVDLVEKIPISDHGSFWLIGAEREVWFRPGKGRDMLLFVGAVAELSVVTVDEWAVRLTRAGQATAARYYDGEYEAWQNQTFPSNFETCGRSTEGLALIWDEDFGESMVDTSANPGRVVEREGYAEALGHVMWLPEAFWPLTGADRGKVRAAFESVELDGALRVTLSKRPFGDDNPPTEEMRRLLFPMSYAR